MGPRKGKVKFFTEADDLETNQGGNRLEVLDEKKLNALRAAELTYTFVSDVNLGTCTDDATSGMSLPIQRNSVLFLTINAVSPSWLSIQAVACTQGNIEYTKLLSRCCPRISTKSCILAIYGCALQWIPFWRQSRSWSRTLRLLTYLGETARSRHVFVIAA